MTIFPIIPNSIILVAGRRLADSTLLYSPFGSIEGPRQLPWSSWTKKNWIRAVETRAVSVDISWETISPRRSLDQKFSSAVSLLVYRTLVTGYQFAPYLKDNPSIRTNYFTWALLWTLDDNFPNYSNSRHFDNNLRQSLTTELEYHYSQESMFSSYSTKLHYFTLELLYMEILLFWGRKW